MNSYKVTFRYYDRIPETIYLPAKDRGVAFSDAHKYITPNDNCCEIIVARVSKAYMEQNSVTYAMQNWRVEVNYLSKDYEDSAMETSTAFQSLWRAERYYDEMCDEYCFDDKRKHARVKLVHYVWKDSKSYADRKELVRANYKGAKA